MEWITAVDDDIDPSVQMLVTADNNELPLISDAIHGSSRWDNCLKQGCIRRWAEANRSAFAQDSSRLASRWPTLRRTASRSSPVTPLRIGKSLLQLDPAPFDPDAYFTRLLGRPQ